MIGKYSCNNSGESAYVRNQGEIKYGSCNDGPSPCWDNQLGSEIGSRSCNNDSTFACFVNAGDIGHNSCNEGTGFSCLSNSSGIGDYSCNSADTLYACANNSAGIGDC